MQRSTLIAILAVALACWSSASRAADDRLQTVKQRGNLIVGVRYDVPTAAWLNPRTNAVEGFEVDLARAVAAKMLGSPDKAVFKEASPAARIPMVQQGDVDVAFTTMVPLPERRAAIDFTHYYFPNEILFMVTDKSTFSGNPADIRNKTACQPQGSVSQTLLLAAAAKSGITANDTKVVNLPGLPECVEALKSGRVDYIFSSKFQMLGLMRQTTGLKMLNTYSIFDSWAAGIAKGNPQLQAALNDAIDAIYRDGTYARIYKKWTNEDPPASWRPWNA